MSGMELPVHYEVTRLPPACLFLLKGLFTEWAMGRFIVLKHEKDKDKENKDNQERKDRDGNNDIRERPLKDELEKGFNDELLNVVLCIGMIEGVCELFHPSFEELFKAFLVLRAVSHPLRNVVIF